MQAHRVALRSRDFEPRQSRARAPDTTRRLMPRTRPFPLRTRGAVTAFFDGGSGPSSGCRVVRSGKGHAPDAAMRSEFHEVCLQLSDIALRVPAAIWFRSALS